ncbi:hypothetical protein B0T21DRAFT_407804 [Apiosordaria backusii]|uniref:CFEM domain-containing protein n=1 Tax=Apiosordaria backusii TaxID=314023 RepID=A0AA40K3M9_9PEZI|nr:hypothetical protein B0T21DRAFT_407804 [Apiosordaria backusii]
MLTLRSLALLSVAGGLVQALDIATLDPCAHNCLLTAPTFDCPASQYACLCPKADWGFAVRDCAVQACGAAYETALMAALTTGCSAVGAPFPAGEAAAATPPTETTAEPAPAEPTTEVPPAAEPTTTESPTAKLDEEVTSTAVESSPTAESTAEPTTTPTGSPGKSSSADESAETSEAPEDEGAPAGLPEAAKIGIGVGVGAAVLALIGVGACIFLRNRHVDKKDDSSSGADRYKISPPMPSREQNPYNHGNNSSDYDIGANELEIKSYRYDDMTEGKQPKPMEPRQMV